MAKKLALTEHSSEFSFRIETDSGYVVSPKVNTLELRRIILQLIFVLSYFSDSEEVLSRFNCTYYDKE